ncbi:BlaI/MecI/CopY family transcriptional regulator [Lysinibacter sp. HNR]|uniref:BlaI/MecI/CopY family transcriptional regulator n=1 Tax=Lysinibacter sp. HNR TaxID=3031408 RepID=UPI002435BFDF|nr:BlaI/MecI/CopY family transcriptional regulator [Lysinibacter sp. HNR]WGD36954.1 BlaI/MecI/CopY family transcriptional regulator [Lysinibacter sp. HNR]
MPGIRTRARGELENEIMRILWESPTPLNAREIQELFTGSTPAYTTVLTTLDRLHKKNRVVRSENSPRKVRFHAARSEDEHASNSMIETLEDAGDREAVLLRFAGNLSNEDVDFLRKAIGSQSTRPQTR